MNYDSFLKDRRLKFPRDSHSIFPASNYHWINYPIDKMLEVYSKKSASEFGTKMHFLAAQLIDLKQPLPDVQKTLNMYVNDAILFDMYPEKQLMYSDEFRGTCDAIVVDKANVLRIHDLKMGEVKASIKQLLIYVALFCLELSILPDNFKDIILRIYQSNDIVEHYATPEEILPIMDKIVAVDEIIRRMKNEN